MCLSRSSCFIYSHKDTNFLFHTQAFESLLCTKMQQKREIYLMCKLLIFWLFLFTLACIYKTFSKHFPRGENWEKSWKLQTPWWMCWKWHKNWIHRGFLAIYDIIFSFTINYCPFMTWKLNQRRGFVYLYVVFCIHAQFCFIYGI